MRPHVSVAASILVSISVELLTPLYDGEARAGTIPRPVTDFGSAGALSVGARDLQLEVFINGSSTDLVAVFRHSVDGSLAISPDQLRNVGIYPADEAIQSNGLVDIAQLPGVSADYRETSQSIHFTVEFAALSERVIEGRGGVRDGAAGTDAQSSLGALMNYTLYTSTGGDDMDDIWGFEGVSGWFEGRIFSPVGVFTNSYVVSVSPNERYDSTRLDTTWSYSNPEWLTSFRAGDVITGGLSWTRPTRLGGLQVQRNFGLRPDLVTMPLPDLSGSAAVPSTVDIYVNNARRVSEEIPAGPFQVTNLPVVTGSGTARVVVRDALGRETSSETPFFASSDLLASGLWDYSAEAGFARRFYGVESNDYDGSFMGSGTLRYGISDQLTLEGHTEVGGGLINGGAGTVFGLGPMGVGSLAGAASSFDGQTGYQLAGSVEFEVGDMHVFTRTQRTFGSYNDIAGVTAEAAQSTWPDDGVFTAAPPRKLDQASISAPLQFDPSTVNLSYTHLETVEHDRSEILGLSFTRPVGRASIFASAFTDLEDDDAFGAFVGISIPLGDDLYTSASVSSDSDGTSVTTDLVKTENAEIGGVGWRLRDTEGAVTNRTAAISYRPSFARIEAGVEQFDDLYRATAQVDGAVVFASQDVFLANRIDDAFTIVDTGVPGVGVQYENRPVGHTNPEGKLLLPDLRSYEPNQITIDPTNLPVDATVGGTRIVTVPADRSGTVVDFDVVTDAKAALVTLRNEAGEYLQAGTVGSVEGASSSFVIGYDGQAFITGLDSRNRITVDLRGRGRCSAEFGYEPREGEQVTIPNVVCHPVE
ncbi:fimbria/pilus outer membrane usher protein [Halomonas huangheensis]|uniref:PapC-like C-terminal domain-containing protein n=1 Tax=Halomonas huangheensis TaxID=1178482 RepID=W1N0Q2_9GAMM|nr:fimbria/pilus outer membrane usher protein [Halomonas huangheensis]ALM52419.1 fimbrial assembly protein [Halomonas huangheensis]ERL49172.1 hypothetical protein BJB45_07815 [Halomonas huangheensis]